ncbi:MAG: GTP 3',8-cyclase MoaA [Oscillospiraceae bacterium]|nr:GTP 3',8-cyclase MoaA [Oscillospiraceae bacterium]
MKDSFGRTIDYLRISLTDRCDLRCIYCMPAEGVENIPHREILTFEETARLVRIMAGLGVRKIRLTGGEPLIRRDICSLVAMIDAVDGIEEICLTTNGTTLSDHSVMLRDAGVDRINVSLDTVDRDVYKRITGADRLDDVMRGIDTAYGLGIPLKINCVPIRNINDSEICSIALLAKDRAIDVRFIELMPIGCGKELNGILSDEISAMLAERFGDPKDAYDMDVSSPAVYHRFEGFRGRIGYISPMSHRFCERCDRIRLTASGYLKLCLQYPAGADLKTPMRNGSSDEELADIIKSAILQKPRAHSFSDRDATDDRKMVQIGG